MSLNEVTSEHVFTFYRPFKLDENVMVDFKLQESEERTLDVDFAGLR